MTVIPLPVRNTDPDTSRKAAAKAVQRRPRVRDAVYLVLCEGGPMTHDQLIAAYGRYSLKVAGWPRASHSSIRTRCSELARDGKVMAVDTAKSSMGNRAIVWRAVVVQMEGTNVQ